LSTSSAAVILVFSAIVVLLLSSISGRTDDSEPRWPTYVSRPVRDRYTTSTDLTPAHQPSSRKDLRMSTLARAHQRSGELNDNNGGRGLYVYDPDGHNLEFLTRPTTT